MLNSVEVDVFKKFAPLLVNSISGGTIFLVSDREKMIWKYASDAFDLATLNVGEELRIGSGQFLAMQEKRIIEEKVPRNIYGIRLVTKSIPILDGDSVIGCFIMAFPRLHPVAGAFNDFAPIIADMFPDGAVLYITGLEEFVSRQCSKKFDLPSVEVGIKIKEEGSAQKAITTKQPISEELDASLYGFPIMVMNYPLFDEDDSSKVVGTFGIALPRQTTIELREMANNLNRGLGEVSAVIEELAASASQISTNEQLLNSNIVGVSELSEQINDVLGFIKQIADETKMLGLNAAIEAARAGEVGRGFGVVAEEIRKLSDQSKGTVVKIRGLTDNIKRKVHETLKNSELTLRASEEQAAASEEMSASVEEITAMAEHLEKIAQRM